MASTNAPDSPPPMEEGINESGKPTLTPPTSEDADKHMGSDSELSDLELDGDKNGEIVPDHYYDDGKIPVFKPTMKQFRSFKDFIGKIDHYGMKSGIVKVIPPPEWRASLPQLDEGVKTIRVKNPITQEFHGTHGTYTQANIEKQRSYNLPQWKALSEESNHQPPAKRGERRRNQEKVVRGGLARAAKAATPSPTTGKRRGPGRPRVRPIPTTTHTNDEDEDDSIIQVPPTPTSPATKPVKTKKEVLSDTESRASPKPRGRQPKSEAKSVSSRRKYNRRDHTEVVDEEAFKYFDYRVYNQDEWTPERCHELETAYWKSLTFNNPMYGADMPGSLFDDSTESWNVAKLENLLDVLGQNVPGVNTAYLYLGMWKATFAWHLEDVDLYSINYIHFGAPKQWYSISQADARRFEAAMKNVWPTDAKNCDQFLRHKTYLISPALLKSQYNIEVNRLVHNEGEFVITFPYGYHSGYNLGYNCAESVNFATEAWLDYGRVAKKCNCEDDSVWVDVEDIERKLRGESTPEYYEETEEEEDEEDEENGITDLPTPPGSEKGKTKPRMTKREREGDDELKPKVKKLRIKLKALTKEPCVLCPNDNPFEALLPTDNGHKAHRRCGLYTPETSVIVDENGNETVCDVAYIDKARLELKCNYCRQKRGSVFQCSQHKCTRAYHATCAASAGVQIDIGDVPVFGEDGTEYIDTGIDFRCRFHREKRDKEATSESLEAAASIYKYARKLVLGEVVQAQFGRQDIFAGVVIANRPSEEMVLLDILPKGDRVEMEYKWLLFLDPTKSQRPKPSEKAIPLPAHLNRKSQTSSEDPLCEVPKPEEWFTSADNDFKWAEFHLGSNPKTSSKVKVDLSKSGFLWYYLGKMSTEAKAHYTGNLSIPISDPTANFMDKVRISAPSQVPVQRKSLAASYPAGANVNALNAARGAAAASAASAASATSVASAASVASVASAIAAVSAASVAPLQISRPPLTQTKSSERPYTGKYAIKDPVPNDYKQKHGIQVDAQALQNQRLFQQSASWSQPLPYQQNPFLMQSNPHPYQSPFGPPSTSVCAPSSSNPAITPSIPLQFLSSSAGHQPKIKQEHTTSDSSLTFPNDYLLQHSRSLSQSQVPIANMMSVALPPNVLRNPLSRSSSSGSSRAASSKMHGPVFAESARSDSVQALAKYPYLHDAALRRPAVYQSPYKQGGGISASYMSTPPALLKEESSKGSSLSEEFLLKRTPSQREAVKAHVRQMSQDIALKQQQAKEEMQKKQAMQTAKRLHRNSISHTRTSSNSHPNGHFIGPLLPEQKTPRGYIKPHLQNIQTHHLNQFSPPPYQTPYLPQSASPLQLHNPSFSPTALSHPPSAYTNNPLNPQNHFANSPPTQQSSFAHHRAASSSSYHNSPPQYSPISHQSHRHSFSSQNRPGSSTGLQFQTVQDFQAQMQQVSRQNTMASRRPSSSYDNVYRELGQSGGGGNHHDLSLSKGDGLGGGGMDLSGLGDGILDRGSGSSALKSGRGTAGGEMLPVMGSGDGY
ncbi:Lysine-specific demethylase 4B [Agyrium rufum]|nr:Lysine-specific demethylase 4B [Agyrium rufum]